MSAGFGRRADAPESRAQSVRLSRQYRKRKRPNLGLRELAILEVAKPGRAPCETTGKRSRERGHRGDKVLNLNTLPIRDLDPRALRPRTPAIFFSCTRALPVRRRRRVCGWLRCPYYRRSDHQPSDGHSNGIKKLAAIHSAIARGRPTRLKSVNRYPPAP